MAGAEIDDAAAAEQPANPAGSLPRLVQLLARETAGLADGPSDSVEQRPAGKAPDVPHREASRRRSRERHGSRFREHRWETRMSVV